MINQDRFIHRFKELVSIPNSSKEEAAMCDYLKKALTELSIPFEEDDTASKINGNCGNLYAYVEGEKAAWAALPWKTASKERIAGA